MKNLASLALVAALLSPHNTPAQDPTAPAAGTPPEQTPPTETTTPASNPTNPVPSAGSGPGDLVSPAPPPESLLVPPLGALPEPTDGAGGASGFMRLKPKPKPNPENDKAFKSALADAGDSQSNSIPFQGPIITLEEALRVTLAKQPSIKLAQEDLEIARAGLQDAIGAFDTHLLANVTHGRSISPQPDGQILAQKEARKALIATEKGVRDFRAGNGPGKIIINNIDDKTGEITGQRTIDVTALGAGEVTGGLKVNNLPQTQGGASQSEINTLIRLEQQAAILNTLSNSPASAQLDKDLIDQIKGVEQVNKKILRDLQTGLRKSIRNFSIQETSLSNFTKYDIGLSKTFRNGVNVAPKVSFDKSGLTNNVKAEMEITVPLAQGVGGHFLRAIEDSAYYDVLGSELTLRHSISNSLLQTALAYWNCVASLQNYMLLRQSQKISETFVTLTKARVESKEVAASEVSKAGARSSTVTSQVIGAEFALLDARRQLAIAMGLEENELNNPPFAAGDIPTEISLGDLAANSGVMISKALASRADRAAAIQQMRSGKVLATAAFRDIKPRFDFFFNMGMASNHDGASPNEQLAAYTDKFVGLSAKGGFSFDWNIVNNPAKAAYNRNLASFRQTDITTRDLERNITNNVLRSAAEIRMTKAQLAATREAARLNRDVLSAERQRYTDGEGSLLDTLQIEEQYTNALVSIIAVKLQFISAVSVLRFETGTLLDPLSGSTPSTVTFNASALSSVPHFDGMAIPPQLPSLADDAIKRPLPLLAKLRNSSRSEVKVHELAIKPSMKYKALTDAPPAPSHKTPVAVQSRNSVSVINAPESRPVPEPAKPTESAPPAVNVGTAPAGKPKPLLKRLFGS